MAVTYTMTWAAGILSAPNIGFSLTDDQGDVTAVVVPTSKIDEVIDPVHRAVADELGRQGGSATGTVTVTIS